MAYQSGAEISPVILAADVAGLRAAASAIFRAGALASVVGFNPPIFWWDPTSVATDNGTSVIKPTDIGVDSPGRWLALSLVSGTALATADTLMARDGNADTAVRNLTAAAVVSAAGLALTGNIQLSALSTSVPIKFRSREQQDLDAATGAKRIERFQFASVATSGAVQSVLGTHVIDAAGGRVKRTITARHNTTGDRASWVYYYDARLVSGTAAFSNGNQGYGVVRAIKDTSMMNAQCELEVSGTAVRALGSGFTGANITWFDELEGVV